MKLVIGLAAALLATGVCTLSGPDAAEAAGAENPCPTVVSRYVTLGDEPVQVNPGAQCDMNLQIEASYEREKTCFFVRQAGSDATLGPFCPEAGGAGLRLPNNIEWIWAEGPSRRAIVVLMPAAHR